MAKAALGLHLAEPASGGTAAAGVLAESRCWALCGTSGGGWHAATYGVLEMRWSIIGLDIGK